MRLIEDRLENMRGGDAHGPERLFDVEVAFDNDGIVRSMKMRALENLGAYAGRSPFQLGKPIGAIVGPYKIKSVEYRAQAVVTNKDHTGRGARLRPGADQPGARARHGRGRHTLGLDKLDVRRRNMIRANEFPYLIPSGTTYDSGDYETVIAKVLADTNYNELIKGARPAARRGQACRHRHRGMPGAVRRQRHLRGAAQSQDHHLDLHGFLPHQRRRQRHHHRHHAHDLVRARP